jgi:hypothetical protein
VTVVLVPVGKGLLHVERGLHLACACWRPHVAASGRRFADVDYHGARAFDDVWPTLVIDAGDGE